MRRRQLLILHVGLIVAAALLGWRLVAEWKRTNQLRYGASERAAARSLSPLLPSLPGWPEVSTGEIVAKNLFTPDRNSDFTEPERPATAASLPIVFGTLNLGERYEALMAEGGAGGSRSFRRVKTGEQVGGYTVIEIRDDKVVVEFQGQRTTVDVYQSANTVARPQASSAPPAAPVVEAAGSPPPQARPSPPPTRTAPTRTSPGADAASHSGPNVRVTIEGNRRRVERDTPFGPQVWYENIE